ncbi:lysine-specific demethylase JMJ28-like isoform X1 [Apium graveolens]|uniref:lysine-specific demethylase JMJ28-like isoform X1 n=1 Tax=Apium graveolens TaxID=4045 RepID=UPI003D795FB5
MPENADLPDNRRCARTDGRKWRCKREVSDGKRYCKDHFVQLQKKGQRKKEKKQELNSRKTGEKSKAKVELKSESDNCKKRSASEALDETLRKMKLKKGDLQLELIREYLVRKVEKKREKDMEESKSGVNNITKELPNGRMEIPVESRENFDNVGPYNVKVGVNCKSIERRSFRSKNVEPIPVCTMQILPHVKETVKMKQGKRRNCHWCHKSSYRILVRCKTCQKESFCEDCIEERGFVKEEVRISCPICRKTCRCRACSISKAKVTTKDVEKVEKLQKLHYLIQLLLPVMEKLNLEQSFEFETEANLKGATRYEIPQIKVGGKNFVCCNCNTSIIGFYRSCKSCSYNLCLSCCHEFRQGKLTGGSKENKIMFPNRKRACTSDNKLQSHRKQNSSSNQGRNSIASPALQRNCKVYDDGRISCPPKFFGGCGGNCILDLRCISYSGWDKELQASLKDIVSRYNFPDASDVGSCCSLCSNTDNRASGSKLLLETARRDDLSENFLYYPTIQDLHIEKIQHFQNHWRKGHPVIVRNVIQVATNATWDPITLFCTYLGKSSEASKTANCLDWFEVEVSDSQIFMGSMEGQTNAFMHQETVKVKGWVCPNLFQEHFPEHFTQIMQSMPLKEYMDPKSGCFNLAAKLPEDMFKPNLGPSVHIAYGEPDEFVQGQFVTRLSYDSYDVVNILVHTTDVPVSQKKINRLKTLLEKYKDQDHNKSSKKMVDQPLTNKTERTLPLNGECMENTEALVFRHRPVIDLNLPDSNAEASNHLGFSSRGDAGSIRSNNMSKANEQEHELDSETTIYCSGTIHRLEDLEHEKLRQHDTQSSSCRKEKSAADSCGAQWDIFRRKDVPNLLEYLRRHCNDSMPAYHSPVHVVHPILDNTFYFDAFQKMRLKKEYNIEPWTFEQKTGEAVIIPAGCPFQVKKYKPSVNIVLEFISPENAPECIRLVDEIRLLPQNHKAKGKYREVQKMTFHGISAAIEEIKSLTCLGQRGQQKFDVITFNIARG